ncbi:hypothetical protein AAFF_G00179840 [Aldrovandia affinis]|uniref:Uncharacterized protein n=1 Tax=Aldrovandia affinis TaxID=143900 RepID=A0AAD7SY62_9TELE|nr:hypothetical protein AAFF_G00179840 [Aldrovandia affinis]
MGNLVFYSFVQKYMNRLPLACLKTNEHSYNAYTDILNNSVAVISQTWRQLFE